MAFRLVDYEFTVGCDSDETAHVLGRLFAACRVDRVARSADRFQLRSPPGGESSDLELMLGAKRLARASPAVVFDQLILETTTRTFERGEFVFVHAGVAARHGVGVLLPAAPRSGKSTTVAGLVRAGFDFFSDEVAALDLSSGAVRPFPRPLMLSASSLTAIPGLEGELPAAYEAFRSMKHRMAPDDLRPGALGDECRIAFIVAPTYSESADTLLEPMSRAETLQLLVEQCFNLDRFGARGFSLLSDVVRGADCYRLTIGELDGALTAVIGLFEALKRTTG